MRLLPTIETVYGKDKTHPDPYLTRVAWGPFFLHVFHRGDNDPDYHDHRRGFWTFPLTGYVEDVLTFPSFRHVAMVTALGEARPCAVTDTPQPYVQTRVVQPFRLHRRDASTPHRIVGRWSGERQLYASPVFPHFRRCPVSSVGAGRIITVGLWDQRDTPREWGFWKRRERWRVALDADGQQVNTRLADGFKWVPWRTYVFGSGE